MKAKITYAGHSAVLLEIEKAGKTLHLAIDPWLQGNPLCPAELHSPKQLDYIVLTHGHADHASDVPRLAEHTGAKVLATYELAMILGAEGVASEQLVPMNKGGSFEEHGIGFHLEHALHSSSFDSPGRGTLYAGEAASVLIDSGELCFFHAGDSCLFSDYQLIGRRFQIDYAFLPIGDRFTMGAKDAACAAEYLGKPTCIPIHYKTFPSLDQNAETFKQQCQERDIEVLELASGASFYCE